jgi:hypothetical protein
MAASFTRRRFCSKGCQRCVWPFARSTVIPSCRPSPRRGVLWLSLVRRPQR